MSNTDEAYKDTDPYQGIAASILPVRTIELTFIEYPDGIVLLQNDTKFCNGATTKHTSKDAELLYEHLRKQGYISA